MNYKDQAKAAGVRYSEKQIAENTKIYESLRKDLQKASNPEYDEDDNPKQSISTAIVKWPIPRAKIMDFLGIIKCHVRAAIDANSSLALKKESASKFVELMTLIDSADAKSFVNDHEQEIFW